MSYLYLLLATFSLVAACTTPVSDDAVLSPSKDGDAAADGGDAAGGASDAGSGNAGESGSSGMDAAIDASMNETLDRDAEVDATTPKACVLNAALCDNGNACDGVEACDPSQALADENGCVNGTPLMCSSDEVCDLTSGKCTSCLVDADGDNDSVAAIACGGADCDDSDAKNFPGNPEVCDGKDNDCASGIDNGLVIPTWYRDQDGDAHGNPAMSMQACVKPMGYAASSDDCDDDKPTRYPGNPEICDNVDNDCNSSVDNGASAPAGCSAPTSGTAACGGGGVCQRSCGSLTLCGNDCVDLATDEDHCGACGYRVVSSGRSGEPALRSCVVGTPSPAWLQIATTNGPIEMPSLAPVWTGRRMVFVNTSAAELLSYTPSADRWDTLPAPPVAASGWKQIVGMPDRNQAMIATASAMFILDDTGAQPKFTSVTWPGSVPNDPYFVYSGTNVFMFERADGASETSGSVYRLSTSTWNSIAPSGLCTYVSAFAHANGFAVAFADADTRSSSSLYCGTSTQQAALLRADTLGWTSASIARTTVLQDRSNSRSTTLSIGNRIFVSGGQDLGRCDAGGRFLEGYTPVLYDPRGGTTDVAAPGVVRASAYALFTGRAIFHYGGLRVGSDCSKFPTSAVSEGHMGLPQNGAITWDAITLPSTMAARGQVLHHDWQQGWTGSEAIVSWGSDGTGTVRTAWRFQPQVGCVCPASADAPAGLPNSCGSVSTSTIVNPSCSPG